MCAFRFEDDKAILEYDDAAIRVLWRRRKLRFSMPSE